MLSSVSARGLADRHQGSSVPLHPGNRQGTNVMMGCGMNVTACLGRCGPYGGHDVFPKAMPGFQQQKRLAAGRLHRSDRDWPAHDRAVLPDRRCPDQALLSQIHRGRRDGRPVLHRANLNASCRAATGGDLLRMVNCNSGKALAVAQDFRQQKRRYRRATPIRSLVVSGRSALVARVRAILQ